MTTSSKLYHSSNCPRCQFPEAPKRCPTCGGPLTAYTMDSFKWDCSPSKCGKGGHVVIECPKRHYAFAVKVYCWTSGCLTCGHLQEKRDERIQ